MPDPVARTTTPTVTRRIVATTVATAIFWKRVTAGAIVLEGARGRGARSRAERRRHSTRRAATGPGRPRTGATPGVRRVSGASRALGLRSRMRRSRAPSARPRRRVLACAVAVAAAACGARAAQPGRPRRLPRRGPAPPRPRIGRRSAGSPSVIPVIISQQVVGPTGSSSRSSTRRRTCPPAPRTGRRRSRSSRPAPASPGPPCRRPSSGRSRGRAANTSRRRSSRRPATGRRSSSPRRPDAPQEAIGVAFQVQEELPVDRRRREGARLEDRPRRPTWAATSRRSAPTRTRTRASTSSRSPTRWPRASRSCWSSRRRRSARAPSAGPRWTASRRPRRRRPDDVAFINVEPYQMTYTEGRLQPVLDANNQLQPVDVGGRVGHPVRAVDLRGGRGRDRARVLRGRRQRRRAEGGSRRSRDLAAASRLGRSSGSSRPEASRTASSRR